MGWNKPKIYLKKGYLGLRYWYLKIEGPHFFPFFRARFGLLLSFNKSRMEMSHHFRVPFESFGLDILRALTKFWGQLARGSALFGPLLPDELEP